MSKAIEIGTLNGIRWVLGDESPEPMTWHDAKIWCKSIGQELPPREVLLLAYLNPEIRSGFADDYYWSSSEYSSNLAWHQYFINGYQNSFNKLYTLPVRAVRAIKIEDLKRKPLSEEWIADNIGFIHRGVSFTRLVRVVEKAHGIGEGNEK